MLFCKRLHETLGCRICSMDYIYIYIYILSYTDRLFRSIRTLQCGLTRRTLEAGIETYIYEYIYIYIYIYIYLFIYYHYYYYYIIAISSILSTIHIILHLARHVGRSKPGSKPIQLYVSLSLRPLGPQAYHVWLRDLLRYLSSNSTSTSRLFIFLYPIGYQSAQLFRRALHYASGGR